MDALRKAEEAKQKAAALVHESEPQPRVSSVAKKLKEASLKPSVDALPAPTTRHSKSVNRSSDKAVSLGDAQEYFDQKARQAQKRIDANQNILQQSTPSTDENPVDYAETSTTEIKQTKDKGNEQAFIGNQRETPSDGYKRFHDRRKSRESAGAVFSAKQPPITKDRNNRIILISLISVVFAVAILWTYQSWTDANQSIISSTDTNFNRGFLGDNQVSELDNLATDEPPPNLETIPPALQAPETNPTPDMTMLNRENPNPVLNDSSLETDYVILVNSDDKDAIVADEQITAEPSMPIATQSQEPDTGYQLQLVRSIEPTALTQTLQNAYNHLQLGNYFQARQLYQKALSTNPNNRDAMMGMASLFRLEGNTSSAQRLYSQILQLNPRDPSARAGLIEATLYSGAPAVAEQELLSLLSDNPASAALHFALGNLYASQQRWNEAESSYFDALAYAKVENPNSLSPDYAFNLAVSLEHLNLPAEAYDFYQQAETAAKISAAGFEPSALSQRLRALEQKQP